MNKFVDLIEINEALFLQKDSGMRTVIIISKCIGENKREQKYPLKFHFKGVYFGHFISSIQLKAVSTELPVINVDYLLYVKVEQIQDEILKGEIIKLKRLEDCWDRS